MLWLDPRVVLHRCVPLSSASVPADQGVDPCVYTALSQQPLSCPHIAAVIFWTCTLHLVVCGQSSLNSYGGLSSDSVPVTRRHTSSLKREIAPTAVADIENKCHCTFLNTCGTFYANPVTNSLMIY